MSDNTSEAKKPQEEVTKEGESAAPAASAEKQEKDPVQELQLEAQKALDIAATEKERREKAEDKIVKLKRKFKELGLDDDEDEEDKPEVPDLEALTQAVEERVLAKIGPKEKEKDSELERSKAAIAELTETLKSKKSITNSSIGSNQDRYEPEEDPLKRLSAADLRFLESRAQRANMTVREYLKKHPLS